MQTESHRFSTSIVISEATFFGLNRIAFTLDQQKPRRDQRAVCCASRAARRSVCLLDDARSTSQIRALVTSLHGAGPQEQRASVCGPAAGRCAPTAIR